MRLGDVEKIELQLDDKTLEKARMLAESRHCDLSELVAYAILKLAVVEPPLDRLLGLYASEPETIDEIVEEVMRDRAADPINQRFEQSTTL
ncbi:MAG: hypothetical protein DSM106950_35795 [Stigonema ocellatum SAG 48.90 = DSM 106950]|nr:hypothetical protein [Stigonema ocellatum SAG 48.90 = DSM 106950]